jgi:Thrombospondin type 1 domain
MNLGQRSSAFGACSNRCGKQQQMREEVCAENDQHLFDDGIPVASKPDF